MKFGILTFHNIPNVGALLQAYSLCMAFRQLGVDCDLIDYTCKNIEKRELKSPDTGNPLKNFLIRILLWPKTQRKIKKCQAFMKKNGAYSTNVYTKDTICDSVKQYNAIISGSDMIWNLHVTDYDWTYFCDFIRIKQKCYAYGSSIGAEWDDKDVSMVKKYLSRYSLIGVRESDTCRTLNNIGIKSRLVCDPTMLLETNIWKKISQEPIETNYVLVYFPSKDNIEAAKKYASKHGLKVILMNWSRAIKGVLNISPLSPAEWIGYFENASAVFTGSFHGLLFSLYFNKPVWTDNYTNRVGSILQKLSIQECYLNKDTNLSYVIDYDRVSSEICEFRQESLSYIKEIIEDCKQ